MAAASIAAPLIAMAPMARPAARAQSRKIAAGRRAPAIHRARLPRERVAVNCDPPRRASIRPAARFQSARAHTARPAGPAPARFAATVSLGLSRRNRSVPRAYPIPLALAPQRQRGCEKSWARQLFAPLEVRAVAAPVAGFPHDIPLTAKPPTQQCRHKATTARNGGCPRISRHTVARRGGFFV